MTARADLICIAGMVAPGGRVLDVGCGDGSLLDMLAREHGVDGRGMEISQDGVNACVARGLPVVQGDADRDLADYPDNAFDYVILSQTIQATQHPDEVLRQMLRIGRNAIVSFPNFGHWRVRLDLALRGRMPVTPRLPCDWFNTPNIHLCTVRDFVNLCRAEGHAIVRAAALTGTQQSAMTRAPGAWTNLCAEQAIFVLQRGGQGGEPPGSRSGGTG